MGKIKMMVRIGLREKMRVVEDELQRKGYVRVSNKLVGPKQYCRREVSDQSSLTPKSDAVIVTLTWGEGLS